MITLCVVPNMTGTKSEKIKITILCVLLDLSYTLPFII